MKENKDSERLTLFTVLFTAVRSVQEVLVHLL